MAVRLLEKFRLGERSAETIWKDLQSSFGYLDYPPTGRSQSSNPKRLNTFKSHYRYSQGVLLEETSNGIRYG